MKVVAGWHPCREGTDWLKKTLTRFHNGGRHAQGHRQHQVSGTSILGRSFLPAGDAAADPHDIDRRQSGANEFEAHLEGRPCPFDPAAKITGCRLWGRIRHERSTISAPAVMIDKQFLLTQLQETRDIFLNSFAGVTEEQSRVKPAPDRLSVLDTIEHLTTAEGIQLKLISTQRTPRAADAAKS